MKNNPSEELLEDMFNQAEEFFPEIKDLFGFSRTRFIVDSKGNTEDLKATKTT